jgi:ribosomal protein L7/L12
MNGEMIMESFMSALLGLGVLGWMISLGRLKQRVDILEVRLEKLLLHVGFDADPNPPATDDVAVLARTPGAKIAAIKAYRRQTGAGLRESKAAVERFMQKGG